MNYAAKVRKASREARKEAEAFVARHARLIEGASPDEVSNATGKIARALWDLRVARLRENEAAEPKST